MRGPKLSYINAGRLIPDHRCEILAKIPARHEYDDRNERAQAHRRGGRAHRVQRSLESAKSNWTRCTTALTFGSDCGDSVTQTLRNPTAQHVVKPADVEPTEVNLSATRFLFVSLTELAVSATIWMVTSALAMANRLRRRQEKHRK